MAFTKNRCFELVGGVAAGPIELLKAAAKMSPHLVPR